MAAKTSRVAISLPKDLLRQVEQARRHLGLARSRAIYEALRLWLRKEEQEKLEAQYARGYEKHPERPGTQTLFQASLSSYSRDEW